MLGIERIFVTPFPRRKLHFSLVANTLHDLRYCCYGHTKICSTVIQGRTTKMRSKPILGSDLEENKTFPTPPSPAAPAWAQPASPSRWGLLERSYPVCLTPVSSQSVFHHYSSHTIAFPSISIQIFPSCRPDRSGNSPFFILTRTRKHLKPSNRDHYSVIIIKNGTLQDPRSPPFSP